MNPAKFILKGNVKLYKFPANFTYEDFLVLRKYEELDKKYLKDRGDNLVVDGGLAQIVDLMIATNTNSFTHCVVGSGTNAPAAGDTNMQTIIGSGVTITNRYRSGAVAYFDTFFSTSANNGSWEETGISTTSAGTILLCRRKFSSTFTKAATNTALISWSISLSAVAD